MLVTCHMVAVTFLCISTKLALRIRMSWRLLCIIFVQDLRGYIFKISNLNLICAVRTGAATFIEVGRLTLVEVVAAVRVKGAGVLERQEFHHLPHDHA